MYSVSPAKGAKAVAIGVCMCLATGLSASSSAQTSLGVAGMSIFNTSCFNSSAANGDCLRRWANGKTQRFQVQPRMNAFGEWEWDTGSC